MFHFSEPLPCSLALPYLCSPSRCWVLTLSYEEVMQKVVLVSLHCGSLGKILVKKCTSSNLGMENCGCKAPESAFFFFFLLKLDKQRFLSSDNTRSLTLWATRELLNLPLKKSSVKIWWNWSSHCGTVGWGSGIAAAQIWSFPSNFHMLKMWPLKKKNDEI